MYVKGLDAHVKKLTILVKLTINFKCVLAEI